MSASYMCEEKGEELCAECRQQQYARQSTTRGWNRKSWTKNRKKKPKRRFSHISIVLTQIGFCFLLHLYQYIYKMYTYTYLFIYLIFLYFSIIFMVCFVVVRHCFSVFMAHVDEWEKKLVNAFSFSCVSLRLAEKRLADMMRAQEHKRNFIQVVPSGLIQMIHHFQTVLHTHQLFLDATWMRNIVVTIQIAGNFLTISHTNTHVLTQKHVRFGFTLAVALNSNVVLVLLFLLLLFHFRSLSGIF